VQPGVIFVTASTYQKERLFHDGERLTLIQDALFEHAERLGFQLQAWAIFPNHYHFIAIAPENPDLKALMKCIQGSSARKLNELDGQIKRMVWYRYWDTQLTFEKSRLARLAYVHQNPVKHGVVKEAEEYSFCSMAWFLRNAEGPFRDTVLSMKTDQVKVYDDFD
jgi:putative transposase